LARAKRRSKSRERKRETVGARHRKIANQRKDFHHKQARHLVARYDLVVVEDLQIANMLRRAKPVLDPENPGQYLANGARAKSGLSRSISGAGWGRFVSILCAKAEEAGRIWIEVDPRHTSDRCENCGHAAPENRVTQAESLYCLWSQRPGRRTRCTQPSTGWTGPSRASRVKRSRRHPVAGEVTKASVRRTDGDGIRGGAAESYRGAERSSIHTRSVPQRFRLSLPHIA
jgi:hypothetical protein